jgi:hypothetical protein
VFIAILKLFDKYGSIELKIENQYIILKTCVEKEDLCFKVIRKSDLSALKKKLDKARDELLKAIKDLLKSIRRHFDETVRESGERLSIVFETYDSPTPMKDLPYDEETVVVSNMLDEMEGKYAADVEKTGLTPWLKELRIRNNAFDQATTDYNVQQAEIPSLQSKEIRIETEKAYQDIITIIDAAIIKEGEAAYVPFVSELNTLIKHNNDLVAQRLGRNKAKKQAKEEKVKEEEGKKQEEAKSEEEEAKKQDETKSENTKTDDTKG